MPRADNVKARSAPASARRSIESSVARLVERHGEALFATARRYTLSREDAEDAYQRGLEILLTKAPPVSEHELLRWTKTVIKHEAFAIWRSRDRTVPSPPEEPLEQATSPAPSPEDQAQSYERLRIGAEAIRRLKPQEVRCLVLRAQGYSYRQICEVTGWTYTKVNRCLTEGRQSFLRRVAGIESGAECDRLAPLLSALADGEATASDLATLRPHLRSCLACRATLRAYRDIPHQAAEVVLPVAGAGAGSEQGPSGLWRLVESATDWAQERAALIGMKVQAAVEGSSAGKVAAVAASTAALAGTTAAVRSLEGDAPPGSLASPGHTRQAPERPATAGLFPVPPPEPLVAETVPQAPPPAAAPVPTAPPPAPATPTAVAPQEVATRSRRFPERLTTRVDDPGTSPLPGVDEEERTIDPMTEPVEPRTGRTSREASLAEEEP